MSGGKMALALLRTFSLTLVAVVGLACNSDERGAQRSGTKIVQPDNPDRESYRQACDDGDALACAELGMAFEKGAHVLVTDEQRAGELFEKARDGGVLDGCVGLGYCLSNGRCGVAKDERRAGELFEKACDGGNLRGCANLAWCFERGNCALRKDARSATELYDQACQGGDSAACKSLTAMISSEYRDAIKTVRDRPGKQHAKECLVGRMAACAALGDCFDYGGCEVAKDPQRAVVLYEYACRRGGAAACAALGDCFSDGGCGIAKDRERAGELYLQSCDGGDWRGCCGLGGCFRTGDCGFPQDAKCAADLPEGPYCYREICGNPRMEEAERARRLFAERCERDKPSRCVDLGYAYEYGVGGVRPNGDRAREAYKWACDHHYADGCGKLKQLRDYDAAIFRMTGLADPAGEGTNAK